MNESVEQKYQFLVNNILDIIIEIDLTGNFIYISPQCLDVFGYSQRELLGKNGFDFINPEDISSIKRTILNAIKSNKPIATEFRTKHKDGHYVHISAKGNLVNCNGKQTIIAVGRDITKQKLMEKKLRKSEDIFNQITDQTFLGFAIFQDFYIKYANTAFSEAIGYGLEEVINWKKAEFLKIIHPDDREILFSLAQKVYSGDNEALNSFQFRMFKKSGEIIWIEVHSKPIIYKGNKADLAFIQDITEMKKAEKRIKESEQNYKLITENSNDLICVINNKFKIEYVNENTHLKLLGYKKEELIGKYASILRFPEEFENMNDLIKTTIKNGEANQEGRLRQKNGPWRWFDIRAKLYKDQNEKWKGLVISRDISKRKESEQKLRESEERYRLITEHANDLIDVLNEKFRYEYINEATHKRVLGYSKEDMLGKFAGNFVHPDELEDIVIKLKDGFVKGVETTECRIKKKDGTYIWYESNGKIFEDRTGMKKALIISRDITDRKIAEKKLEESEQKYRLISENANDLIAILNPEYKHEFINEQTYKKLLGYSNEDMLGKRKWEIIHPDDLQKSIEALKMGFETGEGIIEARLKHKNGHYIWFEFNGQKYLDYKGNIKGLLIIRDISDRKSAEQKLKKSEEKYRGLFNSIKDGIGLTDLDGKIIDCNQSFLEMLGYEKNQVTNLTYEQITPKKWHAKESEILNDQVLMRGYSEEYEKEYIRKDGSIFPIRLRTWLLRDNNDNPTGFWAIIRNITEQKEAEMKLKESEERYRNLYENIAGGTIIIGDDYKIKDVNERTCQITGYSKKELIGQSCDMLCPKGSISRSCPIRGEGKEGFRGMDTTIRCKDNHENPILKNAKKINLEGKPYILENFQDISERKLAEQRLKQSEEKFRHLFENSPFSIILFDQDGVIIDCNSATEKIFAINREELMGQNYLKLAASTPENQLQLRERFDNLIKGHQIEAKDFKFIKKDGNTIWINTRISTINFGEEMLFYAILQDITEKKILENLMFELNQNFFHFTTDFKKNIELLVQTVNNLSNGIMVIYARKLSQKDKEVVQVISSKNEVFECEVKDFKERFFINEIFEQDHEIPHIFSDLDKDHYTSLDPIISKYDIKGGYGKIIRNLDDFKSLICILYQQNPIINYEEQLILLLVSDAIAIEEQRWKLYEKLEEQNVKLSEIDEIKSEFLRRISHELKTPLISIKGYSDLLLELNRKEFDIDTISMLDEIKNGCSRLENLISELLKTSQLDSGQIELETSLENLSFLIKFTTRELGGLAKTRNQIIKLNIHENLLTRFEKERIHEVLSNLISNAIKYTPPYGMITISSEIREGFYIVSVKDNGIGFTEEEKKKVFKQFGKIEHYGKGSYLSTGGTGLGLYISKKIIELHGGKIWMESDGRNKGSTFYISLPIIN